MYREKALEEAKKVFENLPGQMEHAIKVLSYAEEIRAVENVPEEDREIVVVEAILHDIG